MHLNTNYVSLLVQTKHTPTYPTGKIRWGYHHQECSHSLSGHDSSFQTASLFLQSPNLSEKKTTKKTTTPIIYHSLCHHLTHLRYREAGLSTPKNRLMGQREKQGGGDTGWHDSGLCDAREHGRWRQDEQCHWCGVGWGGGLGGVGKDLSQSHLVVFPFLPGNGQLWKLCMSEQMCLLLPALCKIRHFFFLLKIWRKGEDGQADENVLLPEQAKNDYESSKSILLQPSSVHFTQQYTC